MLNDDFEGFLRERENTILSEIRELVGINMNIEIQPTLISPDKPFSNRMIMWDTINSCDEYIYWIDKYFSTEGLRILAQSLNKEKVKNIRILISAQKADERIKNTFKHFREEMKNNQVFCEMKAMPDQKARDIHDRWIISKNSCFNIPSADIIARGQYSEIKKTSNIPPLRNGGMSF